MSDASASAASEACAPSRAGAAGPRLPLLALAALALLTGVAGGLGAGWAPGWPLDATALHNLHGPILVSGLFGVLIGLERALALGERWVYAAPAFAGVGTLLFLAGAPIRLGAAAYALAAAVQSAACLTITLRQPAVFTGTMLVGAFAWLAGNLLWACGWPASDVVGWWLAFLVLTSAAERLELSRRLAPKRGGEAIFLFCMGLLLAGAHNGVGSSNGAALFGFGLLLATIWLLRHDIARITIRRSGQARYMAACQLTAYGWLAAAGLALVGLPSALPLGNDLTLHAILIGFVVSVAFGHSLVTLPAVIGLRIAYTSKLYGPLLLLHLSVALRVAAGLLDWEQGRLASGAMSAAALAGFAVVIAMAVERPRHAA